MMRKLIMSRKPLMPSVFAAPTEMNVTGTPPATPTVYWMSKFYAKMLMNQGLLVHLKETYSLNTGISGTLRVNASINSLEGK